MSAAYEHYLEAGLRQREGREAAIEAREMELRHELVDCPESAFELAQEYPGDERDLLARILTEIKRYREGLIPAVRLGHRLVEIERQAVDETVRFYIEHEF